LKTLLAVILLQFKNIKNKNKKMKKVIVLAGLLLAIAHAAFAEQRGVFMEFHRKINPENSRDVNRALMRLPIEVVYDSDTHKIEINGDESMEAEVFLYNANGTLENYSSSLNTDFTVLTPGTYIIQIQGNGWYAEGKIGV
jgi:c-di-AMP phosphodiesterase-like protein